MKHGSVAFAMVVALAGVAEAGGAAGTVGVGVEFGIAGTAGAGAGGVGAGGLSMNYDGGMFHTGGFLGLADGGDNSDTSYALGGRFYYHVHAGPLTDFGVGGTVSIVDDGNDTTLLFLEPGFQIRVFLDSNVALSFTGGIVVGAADAEGFALTGQLSGGAGVHYYFF